MAKRTALRLWMALSLTVLGFSVPKTLAAPVISEFLADNKSSVADEDGEFSDWIELHNPDAAPVDLKGWFLSDDPARLKRWALPSVTLPAGGRLVVFASGKNRTTPGKPLHTDFKLDADGGSLSLIRPDGKTVASEYASYPKQYANVSFGIAPGAQVRDLLAGATLRFKTPNNTSGFPPNWQSPDFVPGDDWGVGRGFGFGYDTTPGGGGGGNLASKGAASQSSTLGGFSPSLAIDGDLNTFTHTDSADNQSSWTLDLGRDFEIARVVLHNRQSCCQTRLRDITVSLLAADARTVRFRSSLLNPENELDSPAAIELDLFDLNIGTVTARFVRVERTPDPDLSGSNGQGNADEDNVLSLGEVQVFGADTLSYADFIKTDLAAMRGVSATAAILARFDVPSLAKQDPIALKLRYDDGYALWVNGQQFALDHAPAVLDSNARATAERPDATALQEITLNIPPTALVNGENVLAIQALNVSANDDDFLLDARLEAESETVANAVYFETATPGAANSGKWYRSRLEKPDFSARRGYYEKPFELTLSTPSPGATLVYTLDGSEPSETRGSIYQKPISIQTTTVVRARAIRPEHRSSEIASHTYLFLNDVTRQPIAPAGFPARWSSVNGDYAMDPAITTAPAYAGRMAEALRALPSVSFSTDVDNLFGATRGIYANPESAGASWERPISMEWIDPTGGLEFQEGAGLRIQGGYFRNRNVTHKHSLRLVFKNEYGAGKLRQDLFGEFGAAREFDTLVLRAGANDGYAWDAAKDTEQFMRDEFGRRLFRAMGQVSGHGRFVHVYLNGLYWGIYNLCERPNEDFSATYFGGTPEEWDSVNAGDVKSGNLNAWNQLLQGARQTMTLPAFHALQGLDASGVRNPATPVLLDLENYIDYMILNLWGGNWDWPNKNFWFGRRRTADSTGFKFYMWDFENTMGNNRDRSPLNMVAPRSDIASSWVGEPHFRLKTFSEYKLRFADRVQRHFFGTGPLAPAELVRRYQQLAAQLEPAIVAETARWGDDHFRPPQDLTDWLRERDWLLNTYLPQRTAVVLGQFRNAGLFPKLPAPTATPNGGSIAPNTPVVLNTPARWLYYTLNGADPRLPGGAPNPTAIKVEFPNTPIIGGINPNFVPIDASWKFWDTGTDPGVNWAQPDFNDSTWRSGKAELGYGDGDEATEVRFIDADTAQTGVQKNAATFFRASFTVDDLSAFESFALEVRYDDAVAVYLNGKELHRSDNLPANPGFQTFATADKSDNAVDTKTGLPISLLRPGVNHIAASVHQRNATSSDLSFALSLTGLQKGGGPNAAWNSAPPLALNAPTWVRARSWDGTEWSPVVETLFTVDSTAPEPGQLVLSEIAYRPADAQTDAERAVSTDRDDYEFIELMNVGAKSADLDGVRVTGGVQFVFPRGAVLASGARLVLVKHRAAFEARYGRMAPVAGEYDGRLNNGGDVLRIVAKDGRTIHEVSYQSQAPWPNLSSETGATLVLIRPDGRPDPKNPANWRASVLPTGSPGGVDTAPFVGSPDADANNNGRPDLIDYALGNARGLLAALQQSEPGVLRLFIAFESRRAAEDARVWLETAPDITGPWSPIETAFELVQQFPVGPGESRLEYRTAEPTDSHRSRYVRWRVALDSR